MEMEVGPRGGGVRRGRGSRAILFALQTIQGWVYRWNTATIRRGVGWDDALHISSLEFRSTVDGFFPRTAKGNTGEVSSVEVEQGHIYSSLGVTGGAGEASAE